ncbi:hypothetical protein G647_08069 [Cladophialophora carrionii CBS 160.54]|uniref:Uncharacterized protein n=1 Tax=Cladophialophora carrionii CBS 160.54 TaxID=1279043 RepID=V9D6V4_9EURO|nr:uncharacterized protein G647_08069 [Cladophialophora carrionii CBS 160.54]ETI21722.1 hypothetical protein G647_08069 [Cladophialophora carrionii CBS 160.54]
MNGSTYGRSETTDNTTPFPKIDEEVSGSGQERELRETNRLKKRTDSAAGQKRSASGNLLSRFLRTNSDQEKKIEAASRDGSDISAPGRTAMPEAQAQSKRKRKGSLRKTVLGKGRDRKTGDVKKSPLSSAESPFVQPTDEEQEAPPTPRASQDLSSPVSPESPPSWPFRTLSRVSIPSIRSSVASIDPASSAASIISPLLPTTDAETDDDDLVLPRIPGLRKPVSTSSFGTDSYFPIQDPVRRMFGSRTRSPLATQPQSTAGTPSDEEGWDYSETAFWGYVILIVTWIVFVVGMGSCFGVWSWAWDVGETPYAPPELEDDPTLPIVGYYPALLVLTCIMAWVWVVVAWVGMKYFRHADFRGDDG